jgi:D-arabinose 1-dehydrogenase-like Zn-dependent alcohol dehydrogenase
MKLCGIGWHRWDYWSSWAYSEARTCEYCHKSQWWHCRFGRWITENISPDSYPGGTFCQ